MHIQDQVEGEPEGEVEGEGQDQGNRAVPDWSKVGMSLDINGRAYMEDVACIDGFVDPVEGNMIPMFGVGRLPLMHCAMCILI